MMNILKGMTMLKKLLCGATLLCAATISNAAIETFSADVLLQKTNFNENLMLSQFDTMGGTRILESVQFSLAGTILGDIEIESRDAAAAELTAKLEATLTLTDAMLNTLVVTVPSITRIFSASAFDGITDFGGTSGATYLDLTANALEVSMLYTAPGTLAFFTGTGSATFGFDAKATSVATGAGSITSAFNTSASGQAIVIYNYRMKPPVQVSSPSQVAFLGLGLLAFAGMRKVIK
jgi:hypothetical protein